MVSFFFFFLQLWFLITEETLVEKHFFVKNTNGQVVQSKCQIPDMSSHGQMSVIYYQQTKYIYYIFIVIY